MRSRTTHGKPFSRAVWHGTPGTGVLYSQRVETTSNRSHGHDGTVNPRATVHLRQINPLRQLTHNKPNQQHVAKFTPEKHTLRQHPRTGYDARDCRALDVDARACEAPNIQSVTPDVNFGRRL
jgi:hypothetical protein